MVPFIVRRSIGAVIVLFVVSVITFAIFIVIPGGDPATRMAGKNATDENIANIRETWGFDEPIYVQYTTMMKKVFSGELISYTTQQDVLTEIKRGLPATISLAVGAAIIWLFFGVLVGVIAAVKAGRWSDRAITIAALIGISMPVFWLGIIARYYLGPENAGIFPDGQYVPLTENPVQWFYHLMLPWVVLAILFIGFYGRVLRSNILDSINEDYVRTARAKGMPPRRVLIKHVLRNSMIPIVTLFALDFAAVLGGGAILTETVFDLNGVGQYAARSVRALDLPPIMAVTLLGAFFIVTFNMIVDFMYAYLDPRIRPS
jgi:peptide/nickel transport system permease protein